MYKNLYIIASGCLICLGVFVVSFTGTARGRADFAWNNGTEPQTLDPGLASGQPESAIAIGLFEGLTTYHPETLEAVPGVAHSWDIDGLTYTFHLRPDSWWVQGDEIFTVNGKKRNVVAEDFIYAWTRHLLPETGSEYSYLLHGITGVEAFEDLVAKNWTELIERYSREHPETVVTGPAALLPADRAALDDFRQSAFERRVGVRALDPLTLEVTLKSPAPYFLFLTSFYTNSPVPREAIEAHGDPWVQPENIVSNGPYFLEDWKFNSHVRLRKNRHYWENEAHAEGRIAALRGNAEPNAQERRELELLERLGPFVENGLEILDALGVEEQNTSVNLYLNGDVDRLRELSPEVQGDLILEQRRRPGSLGHVHYGPFQIVYYYVINLELPVFRDAEIGRKLRRALALAIDRKTITEIVTRGYQQPAYGIVPPGNPGYPSLPLFGNGSFEDDLAEARRLLREVRASGVRIPKLGILYNTSEGHARIAAFVQSVWQGELGIEVELTNQEWGVYLNSKRSSQFEIARSGWIGDYPDPNTYLDMFTTGNQNNDPKYSNPIYDRIVKGYCANILEALENRGSREAMLADVASWPQHETVIAKHKLPDGRGLFAALSEAVKGYGEVPESGRLDQAFAIRLLLFQVAEAMLMYDMPIIPFYFYTLTQLWPPELEGLEMNSRDVHPLKTLRWKDGKRPTGSRYKEFPRFPTLPPEERPSDKG